MALLGSQAVIHSLAPTTWFPQGVSTTLSLLFVSFYLHLVLSSGLDLGVAESLQGVHLNDIKQTCLPVISQQFYIFEANHFL